MSNTKKNAGRNVKNVVTQDDRPVCLTPMHSIVVKHPNDEVEELVGPTETLAKVIGEMLKSGRSVLAVYQLDEHLERVVGAEKPLEPGSPKERAEPYLEEAARICERAMVKYKGAKAGAGFAYVTRAGAGQAGDVVLPLKWAGIPESQDVNRQQYGFEAAAKFLTKKTGDQYVANSYLD